ncbi:tetratricopeptide repeat 33 [Pelobates cultripes]|uniref:Tetratricopeptide repeat 33 n=1 Tax=Pelobates cultripes TaxID=61616 RepID=A0AAD1SAV7_PELCU|nr:tetratricopeptide repeat 33 [Pelobates cultripes]
MASFGWKRKIGEKVSKVTSQQFEEEAADLTENEEVDWHHTIKRKKEVLLEDNIVKSKSLKEEGITMAQNGRHLEAVKHWEEAIHLTPEDATLYEMKSQALMCLDEIFQAVQAAETAVQRDPHFVEAWQTLGRAQLGLGEITMAIRSFQVGIHLYPANSELWEEDLTWALKLLQQKKVAGKAEKIKINTKEINAEQELIPDYDFESDEVVVACAAIAQRQKLLANNIGIVVSASGSVTKGGQNISEQASDETETLIKAR